MSTDFLTKSGGYLYAFITARSRLQKRLLQVLSDVFAVIFALTSTWLINGLFGHADGARSYALTMLCMVLFVPVLLHFFGTYRAIVRYMTTMYAVRLTLVAIISALFAVAVISIQFGSLQLGLFSDLFASTLILISAPRYAFRLAMRFNEDKELAIVYGAGAAGRQLASALSSSEEYRVIAFVDDSSTLAGANVLGLPVYGAGELQHLVEDKDVDTVLLALPSASRTRRREIVESLEHLSVKVQTIPGMMDLISGSAQINEVQDVSIEDLLGRDSVPPNQSLITANIAGKAVMVTGAGGSIGSELCRQALLQKPDSIVLYELTEYALYAIDSDLRELARSTGQDVKIVPVLGNVQDEHHLRSIMEAHGVQTVYHAAAYKHVPLVEHNPIAGLGNNVLGTWNAAKAAIAAKVEVFVLVSTDKAVRPTNVMGASKRFAELGIQALAKSATDTKLCMVRFGNVLGSSGSVVPLFRSQIASGGPITVTHPDINRYFMTIPEAAQLVIQAGALGSHGEVFVLDMGNPVRIVDLAERMIRLSGLELKSEENPAGDIEIVFTGLRPGEKLYEELLIEDSDERTMHERIMVAAEPALEFDAYKAALRKFEVALTTGDLDGLRRLLLELPISWSPDAERMFDYGVDPEKRSALRVVS